MSRVKLLIVTALGVLALSAIASSAAFAEPTAKCEKLGTKPALTQICVQNKAGELLVLGLPALETIEFLATQEGLVHELTIKEGPTISCAKGSATGLVDGQPTESALLEKVKIVFTECIVKTNEAECEVLSDGPGTTGTPGVIESEALDADFQNQSTEDGAIEFLPEAVGGAFANFSIDSKTGKTCPFTVLAVVKVSPEGNPLCVLLASNETLEEVDQELKLLTCSKALLETLSQSSELSTTFDVILDRASTTWSVEKWPEHPLWGLFLTETIS
jgi:hypothetical protein